MEFDMKILLNISYLGSAYCGYQVQKNGVSIQGKLNEAAEALFGYECDVVGCSRTDRGVHADMFCATLTKKGESDIDSTIPEDAIPMALNRFLPSDIAVRAASYVDSEFHPRYDVKQKEYVYKIFDSRLPDPFLSGRVWHYPRAISDEDVARMDMAAKEFVGRYDFSSFMASGSSVSDTVRTIFSASVRREGNLVVFSVCGDGFLYNMVRIMTGTLVAVAEGKIEVSDIKNIILSCDRRLAGATAPAEGLYLHKVVY